MIGDDISNIRTQLKGKRNVQVDTVTGLNFDNGDQIQHFNSGGFQLRDDTPDGFTGAITETALANLFSDFDFQAYDVCLLDDGSNQYLAFNDDVAGWNNDGLIDITGYSGNYLSAIV